MNTKSISKPFGNAIKDRSVAGRTFLVQILVAALLLAAVAVYSRVTAQQADPVISAVEASTASNPELMLARRFTVEHPPASNQAYLAANPELALARRFAAMKKPTETSLLAANRELSFARHNGINQILATIHADVSTNPELLMARRFGKEMERNNTLEYLAANPELTLIRRYTSTLSNK